MPNTTPSHITRVKLSDPQKRLLKEISEGPQHCVEYYPPAKSLVKRGLAEWRGDRMFLTAAGAAWLLQGE